MLCNSIFVTEESYKRRVLRVCLSNKGPKGEAEAVLAGVLGKDELVIRTAASVFKPNPAFVAQIDVYRAETET